MGKIVSITTFTDPICVWCWGTEPVYRALETHYPDLIDFPMVVGGLVEDIRLFGDSESGIGGDPEKTNLAITRHWKEAVEVLHMPVGIGGFRVFSEETPSSYPHDKAYISAKLIAPEKADRLIRRVREATIVESKRTGRAEVLAELAGEVGIDPKQFLETFGSEEVHRLFEQDLQKTREAQVDVLPTFVIRYGDKKPVILAGYIPYDRFVQVLDQLSDGALKPIAVQPTIDKLLELLQKHPRLAAEEVFQAFDFDSREECDRWLETLGERGLIARQSIGTGVFVTL